MLEKESRSQHAAGEKALIYIRQVLFWRGNTLKKTKGPCCAHLFQNSVALAFGSLGYLNIYWNSPRKGGNLINTTLWFYNILECFFPGRIFHFSTFEKKKNLYRSQSITNSRLHSLFHANGVDVLLFTIQ